MAIARKAIGADSAARKMPRGTTPLKAMAATPNLVAPSTVLPTEQVQKVVLTGRKRKLKDAATSTKARKALPKYKRARFEKDDTIYATKSQSLEPLEPLERSESVEPLESAALSPDYDYVPSSPPIPRARKSGRPRYPQVESVDIPESIDIADPVTTPTAFAFKEDFLDSIKQDVKDIYDQLTAPDLNEIQMELPETVRQHAKKGLYVSPYTSEYLFHLYLLAYADNNPNICDLVADTWIREFQKLDGMPGTRIWKTNPVPWVDPDLYPIPGPDNGDALLDPKVTAFEALRLHELYEYTESGCGARALWADAMALCGGKLEARLDGTERYPMGMGGGLGMGPGPEGWHAGLMWDVMRTCMRLVRAKRTLKIEEKHPTAWCDRYHEHAKWGQKCYRQLAWEQVNGKMDDGEDDCGDGEAKRDSCDVDEGNGDLFEQMMFEEFSREGDEDGEI